MLDQLKHEFRQKAEALGIDPIEGATSYQVALIKAELAKAPRRHHLRVFDVDQRGNLMQEVQLSTAQLKLVRLMQANGGTVDASQHDLRTVNALLAKGVARELATGVIALTSTGLRALDEGITPESPEPEADPPQVVTSAAAPDATAACTNECSECFNSRVLDYLMSLSPAVRNIYEAMQGIDTAQQALDATTERFKRL